MRAREMRAREMRAREMRAREMRAREMRAREMHACEIRACEMHACEMRCTPVRCTPVSIKWVCGGWFELVVDGFCDFDFRKSGTERYGPNLPPYSLPRALRTLDLDVYR
jgi:hypothetical protein